MASTAADRPRRLPRRAWGGVAKRTFDEFRADELTDWAAALTYYGILSIFPALVAIVSILGLVGHSATQPLLDNLNSFAPGPARDILANALRGLAHTRSGAGIVFAVGLVGALWSSSGYVGGFMKAANRIWDVPEGRPFWWTIPLRVGVTLLMLVLLAASAVMVVVTGPLADRVGKLIGIGSAAVTAWDIAKWPVLILVVALMLSILYHAAPNVRHPRFAGSRRERSSRSSSGSAPRRCSASTCRSSARTTRRTARSARSSSSSSGSG